MIILFCKCKLEPVDSFAGVARVAVLTVRFLVIVLIIVERAVDGRNAVLGAEIADAVYNVRRRVVIHLDKVDGVAHAGVAVVVIVDIVARDERQPSAAFDMNAVLDAAFCRLDCDVGDCLAANACGRAVLHLRLPVTRNANTVENIGNCCGGGSRSSRRLCNRHNTADLFCDIGIVRGNKASDVSAVDLHGSLANDVVARVTLGDSKAVSAHSCHQSDMVCACRAVTDAVIRPVIDDRAADFRFVSVVLNPNAALDSVVAETTAAAFCTCVLSDTGFEPCSGTLRIQSQHTKRREPAFCSRPAAGSVRYRFSESPRERCRLPLRQASC